MTPDVSPTKEIVMNTLHLIKRELVSRDAENETLCVTLVEFHVSSLRNSAVITNLRVTGDGSRDDTLVQAALFKQFSFLVCLDELVVDSVKLLELIGHLERVCPSQRFRISQRSDTGIPHE